MIKEYFYSKEKDEELEKLSEQINAIPTFEGKVEFFKTISKETYYELLSFLRWETAKEQYKKELGVLGSKSGRDMDKMKGSGLTTTSAGQSMTFEEAELTLVCKKLFRQRLESENIPSDIVESFYSDNDLHDMYIGEVIDIIR